MKWGQARFHHESHRATASFSDKSLPRRSRIPTTLKADVRVFSEVVQLSEQEHQEFWIAVEVEGALHNRTLLPDSTIDVILVVDNA